jgi:epoxide hydrolase 4
LVCIFIIFPSRGSIWRIDFDPIDQKWTKMAKIEHLYVTTNGIRLHVVVSGDPSGKPVILLHGFPEFWYGWRHQIPALVEAGYRVIVPDQRGYNLSEHPKSVLEYRLDELGKDVIGLIDHWDYERVDIVGHDWGAAVAWWVGFSYPEKVRHLTILNVPHPSVMLETIRKSPRQMLKSWYIGFFLVPGLADWLMQINQYTGALKLLKASGRNATFTDEDLTEYRKAWANSGGLTGMINWYRALVRYRSPLTSDTSIHVPTLILWGKKDVALSHEMAEKSLGFCDNGLLVYFDDATHWVQHDAAENVNRELIAFMR